MARRGVGGHNEREWPPSLSRLSTLWCDARSLASLILASPLHTPHSLYSPRFLFLFFALFYRLLHSTLGCALLR